MSAEWMSATSEEMNVDLAGVTAVVTGGASGIGAAVVRRLARAGAAVAAWDVQPAVEAGSEDGNVARFVVDVSSPAAVEAAMEDTVRALGTATVLVNCAGVRDQIPTLEMTAEDWRRVIGTDLDGTFYCLLAAARRMVAAGVGGSIVNIASITGLRAVPNQVAYITAKAGIIGLTRSAAFDLGRHGIRVNALAPGHIITPLTLPGLTPALREHLATIPAGRSGTPEEVAELILFLASGASRYITGETIVIDGGWTLGVSIPQRPPA